MDSSNLVLEAARKNDVQLLRKLLRDGNHFASVNEIGCAVVHIAARIGSVPILNALLDAARDDGLSIEDIKSIICSSGNNGGMPRIQDRGHYTVYYALACLFVQSTRVGYSFVAEWSLQMKCDYCPRVDHAYIVNAMGSGDEVEVISIPPLHTAIENGDLESVENILKDGADLSMIDEEGYTALNTAVLFEHKNIVQRIIQEDFDMAITQTSGCSILHLAANHQNESIIKILLDKVKEVYKTPDKILSTFCLPNKFSETPLSIAVKYAGKEVFRLLLNLQISSSVPVNDIALLHAACRHQSVDMLRIIIQKFPHLIHVKEDHYCPVHACAMHGNLEMFNILIKAGGSLQSKNLKTGCTVLHSAAKNFNTEILEYLLEDSHVDLNRTEGKGNTPLHIAARTGNLYAVQILLKRGANASVLNNYEMCPLAEALAQGFYDVSAILSDVTSKALGTSVIQQASRGDGDALLRLVLEKGFSVQDYSDFWTIFLTNLPSHMFPYEYHDKSAQVQLLIENGMDFRGIENMWKACPDCCWMHFGLAPATMKILAKYGALEKMPICIERRTGLHVLDERYIIYSCSTLAQKIRIDQFEDFMVTNGNVFTQQRSVQTLSDFCRCTIRQTLAQRRHVIRRKDVRQLPLPKWTKKYLVYET